MKGQWTNSRREVESHKDRQQGAICPEEKLRGLKAFRSDAITVSRPPTRNKKCVFSRFVLLLIWPHVWLSQHSAQC